MGRVGHALVAEAPAFRVIRQAAMALRAVAFEHEKPRDRDLCSAALKRVQEQPLTHLPRPPELHRRGV